MDKPSVYAELSRRRFLQLAGSLAGMAALAACVPATSPGTAPAAGAAAGPEVANILFTFWGSPQEKEDVLIMVDNFNDSHPAIQVSAQHIPSAYGEKISTMVAGGSPPDIAYMGEPMAETFASEDKLLDLRPFFEMDEQASNYLPQLQFHYASKYIGVGIAGESTVMYYNRDLFDAAGIDYPPSKPEEAWTWDEYVEVARLLTKDVNGNNAASSSFDPDQIETFGVSFMQWWGGYLPLIYSNGGDFANQEGTELLLNQPEAVEVLQNLQDLIHVHHISPTPSQTATLPAAEVMMQTGKVAMDINGHWKVLDYSQMEMNWGMAILPKFKEPRTAFYCAPTVAFAATKYPAETAEFYIFMHDPTQCDLFAKGLWMPVSEDYYTDPEKTRSWLEGLPGVYPPEAYDVLIEFVYKHTPQQPPVYWMKNQAQIFDEAINPAQSALWSGSMTAQQAMDQAVADAAPLMRGRWT